MQCAKCSKEIADRYKYCFSCFRKINYTPDELRAAMFLDEAEGKYEVDNEPI